MSRSAFLGFATVFASFQLAACVSAGGSLELEREAIEVNTHGVVSHTDGERGQGKSIIRTEKDSRGQGADGKGVADASHEKHPHHSHHAHKEAQEHHQHHEGHKHDAPEPPANAGQDAHVKPVHDPEDDKKGDVPFRQEVGASGMEFGNPFGESNDPSHKIAAFDHAAELAKAKEAHHRQIHNEFDSDAELAQLESEADMIPGLGNPSDLANRAMDMMNGAAGVIPEDYPFVCICLASGVCDEPMPEGKKTPCPGRIGQKAAATRAPLGVAAALVALAMSLRS